MRSTQLVERCLCDLRVLVWVREAVELLLGVLSRCSEHARSQGKNQVARVHACVHEKVGQVRTEQKTGSVCH